MKHLLLFGGIFSFITACKHKPIIPAAIPYQCDTGISFSGKIQNIIINNCAYSGCHDGNNLVYLGNYTAIHDAVVQIRSSIVRKSMPIGDTLTAINYNDILCWIDSGYKNN